MFVFKSNKQYMYPGTKVQHIKKASPESEALKSALLSSEGNAGGKTMHRIETPETDPGIVDR
jgi:hypothetical protein